MYAPRESLYEYELGALRRRVSALRLTVILLLAVNATASFYNLPAEIWQTLLYVWVWLLIAASFAVGPEFERRLAEIRATRTEVKIRARRAKAAYRATRPEAEFGERGQGDPDYAKYRHLPRVPTRAPDREAFVVLTLLALLTLGLRRLLSSVDVANLGPTDAPAIAAVAVSAPTLIALGIAAVPRLLRAWGAKQKDTGQGSGAAATGQAALIRAEKEGEAAVLKARAELKRAEAEYLRAQKGLDPLPPAQHPTPDQPPALPPTGNASAPAPDETPHLPLT
ncbi:hypothetical protein [Streptomyces sp. NPDC058268]|uniref:hypothetical protein n=1 Tax=Streptomyces sp. NPDC058268 TaxID=3346413 RepID=UPI0036EB48E1